MRRGGHGMPQPLEHPLLSHARKVEIALREKGQPFADETSDDFGAGRDDGPLAARNPRAEVPVLLTARRRSPTPR